MNPRRIKKLSYSLREVSRITSLKAYVLRYWETEFETLRPRKDRNGNRSYRIDDIKLIFHLKKLLYEDKFTIAGARQKLKALQQSGRQMDLSFERLRQEDAVLEIKKGLHEILAMLEPEAKAPAAALAPQVTIVTKPSKRKPAKRASRHTAPFANESAASPTMFFGADTVAD